MWRLMLMFLRFDSRFSPTVTPELAGIAAGGVGIAAWLNKLTGSGEAFDPGIVNALVSIGVASAPASDGH
jgi:hypothetical protein